MQINFSKTGVYYVNIGIKNKVLKENTLIILNQQKQNIV